MATLSVIVPVYNTAPYLARALDSVLCQTGAEIEVIAVNDGSTDTSAEILAEYEKKDARVRVFTKENGGLADARNLGIEHARGEYLAFLDSDDAFSPDFVREMLGKAEREGLDMVLCDWDYVFPDGKRTRAYSTKPFDTTPSRRALLAAPMVCTRLFRRRLFDTLRFEKGIYYEDLQLTPRLFLQAERIGFVEQPLYDYYRREGSIMHKSAMSERQLDIFSVLSSLREAFEAQGKGEEYARELEFLHIEHLLRSAALRFAPYPEGKELIGRLADTVNGAYPNWKKNEYLKAVSPFFRLTVFCSSRRWRTALRLLASLSS